MFHKFINDINIFAPTVVLNNKINVMGRYRISESGYRACILIYFVIFRRKTLLNGPDLKLFILVGWDRSFLAVAWPTGVQLVFFFCSGVSTQGSPSSGSLLNL